jgi:hypothetical protein
MYLNKGIDINIINDITYKYYYVESYYDDNVDVVYYKVLFKKSIV